MTPEELEIAKAACCVGTMWDEYEGTEDFDRLVGKRVQHLIELVRKSQPSLPSNLYEAAEIYAGRNASYEYLDKPFRDAFKSGAEWMAGQGVSFDTEMSWLDSFGFQIGWPEDTSIFDCFNPGEKVVVQFRKK